MNIVIFGATGATGQQLIAQGLSQGHQVTAFVRTPSKLNLKNDRLNVFKGDVQDYAAVEDAIRNQDAVLSALGAATPFVHNAALIQGIKHITAAMEKLEVKRIIYQSFLGVRENRHELGFLVNKVFSVLIKNSIEDHEKKETIIINSSLTWTIIRCALLTNGAHTGKYKAGEHMEDSLVPRISRADVADFMLKQLTHNEYYMKKPRIMY